MKKAVSKKPSKKTLPKLKKYLNGALTTDPNTPIGHQISSTQPIQNFPMYQQYNGKYYSGMGKMSADSFKTTSRQYSSGMIPNAQEISQAEYNKYQGTGNMMPTYNSPGYTPITSTPNITNVVPTNSMGGTHGHKHQHNQLHPHWNDSPPNGNYGVPTFETGGPVVDASTQQQIDAQNQQQTNKNIGTGIAAGGAAIGGATNVMNTYNQPHSTLRQQQTSVSNGATGVVSAINPLIGAGVGLTNSIAKPIRNYAEETNADGTLKNKNLAKVGSVVGGLMDPLGQAIPAIGEGIYDPNQYVSHLETENKNKIAADKAVQLQSQKTYAMGGVNRGQANAEVEKQEVMRMPNGGTEQVDGPSHAQGGVPVNIPTGTQIFSDRLKMPGTKDTFAKLAAKYKTDKQEKVLASGDASSEAKATAKLVSDLKQKKLSQIFEAQESLKQAKVQAYAQKMGVTLPQAKGDDNQLDTAQNTQGGQDYPEQAYGGKFPLGGTVGDTTKGQYVDGQWQEFNQPQFDYSTKEGSFLADGTQTSSAYGRPMMQNAPSGNALIPENPYTAQEKQLNAGFNNSVIPGSKSYKSINQPKDYSNLRDAAGLAGNVIGQNIGNIADLYMTKGGKKYDKENSGQLTSQKLDSTEAIRQSDMEAAAARGSLKDATNGNVGAYLSNLSQVQTQNSLNKAKILEQYQNTNAGISNNDLYHNQATRMQDKANEQQNKARSEDIARTAINSIGQNTAGATRDFKANKMDQYSLDIISKAYPDYEYNETKRGWYHKTTGAKLDPNTTKAQG